MKSRDEIVIIMLQWLRLYTLGSRGSRELKTFLETRLISSRVDQKLKNKRGEIHAFKEGIRLEIMAIGSGRGRRLKASLERVFGCGVVASIPRKIRLDLASIWSQGDPDFCRDFRHDRATIGPRSGVNHDARASSIACRSMGDESAPIPRQNLLDRGPIGPRSWSSSTMFHRRPIVL